MGIRIFLTDFQVILICIRVENYCDWLINATSKLAFLGDACCDENEARECFEKRKQKELEFAKEYDWEIDDGEMDFVAYEDGNYNNNFTQLMWHKQEFEI